MNRVLLPVGKPRYRSGAQGNGVEEYWSDGVMEIKRNTERPTPNAEHRTPNAAWKKDVAW